TIVPENTNPVAIDAELSADEDGTAVTTTILTSDPDSDNDASDLIYLITENPAEGAVVSNGDGTFTFDPGAAFQDLSAGQTRTVTFSYSATDAHGVSSTGTVTVTVTGVNDAPSVTGSLSLNALKGGSPVITDNVNGMDIDQGD